MRPEIRRARTDDAKAIARLIQACFGEYADPARVARRLALDSAFALVACQSGQVVAFADSFLTISAAGQRRMELDLLAVAESARGQGIASMLVARSMALAAETKADLLRALVAVDNEAMARVCGSLGLTPSSPVALYVADTVSCSESTISNAADSAHLVPVETLAYSGIWLEGVVSRAAIERARRLAVKRNFSRIGAVLPAGDSAARDLLAAADFSFVAAYRWWTLKPGSGLA